jgi:AraC-like DNA-binding protein
MKPSFYKILFDKETPFRCTYIDKLSFDHPWHFHPEIELTLILESEGVRYVGDNTSNFCKGDLILIGSNLPHIWINENEKNKVSRSRRITLQFPKNLMDTMFTHAEELEPVAQLFQKAERGVYFSAKTSREIEPLFMKINERKGLPKWISVFELLQKLTQAKNYTLLASPGYQTNLTNRDIDRMNQVFQYIRNNIENKITLDEISSIACLTKPSFCRLFKQKTGKSFIIFLNEFRINHAKRMLLEGKHIPIGRIAHKSGFNSVQHFNAKFKKYNDGLTPTEYLKKLKIT